MITCDSVTGLFQEIKKSYDSSSKEIFPVLIGGCSRSGKSTLSRKLVENCNQAGIEASIVALDSWLISVDQRKHGSAVWERYEMDSCNKAIEKLVKGEMIAPPFYDPISRRRIEGMNANPVKINSGIVIVEGVIALSDHGLQKQKGISVFVTVPHLTRIKRLLDFYGRIKKIPRSEYKWIIRERETEEVPFIERSIQFADIVYRDNQFQSQMKINS